MHGREPRRFPNATELPLRPLTSHNIPPPMSPVNMAGDMVEVERDRLEEKRIVVTPVEYDAAAEARVRHKLDWNMMPLLFILCKC